MALLKIKRKNDQLVMIGSLDEIRFVQRELEVHLPKTTIAGAFYAAELENTNQTSDLPWLGERQDALQFLKEHDEVTHVFYITASASLDDAVAISQFCEREGRLFCIVDPLANRIRRKIVTQPVGDAVLVLLAPCPMSSFVNRSIKRFVDLSLSFLFLTTLFPIIYLFKAIEVKRKKQGAVFALFRCYGMNGNQMCVPVFSKDGYHSTCGWLPLFLKVFTGKMSLVGPRPITSDCIEEYVHHLRRYGVRHYAKTGIVDWPYYLKSCGYQHYVDSLGDRARADIWYTEHWTICLDVRILLCAISNVLFKGK